MQLKEEVMQQSGHPIFEKMCPLLRRNMFEFKMAQCFINYSLCIRLSASRGASSMKDCSFPSRTPTGVRTVLSITPSSSITCLGGGCNSLLLLILVLFFNCPSFLCLLVSTSLLFTTLFGVIHECITCWKCYFRLMELFQKDQDSKSQVKSNNTHISASVQHEGNYEWTLSLVNLHFK